MASVHNREFKNLNFSQIILITVVERYDGITMPY